MSTQQSLQRQIEEIFDALGNAERRVARIMLSNYPLSAMDTIASISHQANVSDPTVLRFIKKLGFSRYAVFQNRLKEELDQRMQGPLGFPREQVKPDSDLMQYLGNFMHSLTTNIEETFRNLPLSEVRGVLQELGDNRKHIHLLGGEFTDAIARYAYFHLRKMRPNVHVIQGQLPSRIDHLLDLGKKDVLIVFDVRRYQPDIVQFVARAKERVGSIILFTDQWLSPAAKHATYVLPCRVESMSRWDSLVGVAGVVEALMSCMAERQWAKIKVRLESLEAIREHISSSQYADEKS